MLVCDCCGLVAIMKARYCLEFMGIAFLYYPRKTGTQALKIFLPPPPGSSLSLTVLWMSHLGPGSPTVLYSAFGQVVGHSDSFCLLHKEVSVMTGKDCTCLWT